MGWASSPRSVKGACVAHPTRSSGVFFYLEVPNESFSTAPDHVRILKYQEFPEDTVHNKCYCGLVENQEADSLYQY